MEIKTLYTRENKLFNRKEMSFLVNFDGSTVSKEKAKTEICKLLNLNPDGLIITGISQKTGIRQCIVDAHYYANATDIKKFEAAHLIKRLEKKNEKADESSKGNAAAEQKAESKQ